MARRPPPGILGFVALPPVTLILGGARSGKSRHAEALVEEAAGNGLYIATAAAGDGEMEARIRHHRERRGPFWTTVEEPLHLAHAIEAHALPGRPILVDCLTLWLSNLMLEGRAVEPATDRLLATLEEASVPVVLVANEVGQGIVPENALARAFRDHAGRMNQRIAEMADRVVMMVAGLPMTVKGEESDLPG
ncbi:bifunctional adenosylcobinamide kinase/adenosylcobinamide-phosphate guanylyltransferase [Stella sp.]|uniref:bifunctional adenosylcobinamide kinase/adenosylcobinamide-phosphate guanylyltransferase n=1 Tax=Stella sp. TaxID=2912054 RepID=UPI0035AFB822